MKKGNSGVKDSTSLAGQERWREAVVNGRKIFHSCTKHVTSYSWDEGLLIGRINQLFVS